MDGHCHINFGVIQRAANQTAVKRLAYQSCGHFRDDLGNTGDYTAHLKWHRGTVVLLPRDAPPTYADPAEFRDALTKSERRADAQEGRTVNITLPRAIPAGLELVCLSWVFAPLIDLGMAAQIDVERPPASDGGDNPHGHVTLTQRELTPTGFGPKRRDWDAKFRENDGKRMRGFLAARLTAVCALLGVSAHVDPRRNDERGLGRPEYHHSEIAWRKYERGGYCPELDEIFENREFLTFIEDFPLPPRLPENINAIVSAVGERNAYPNLLWIRAAEIERIATDAGMTVHRIDTDDLPYLMLMESGRGLIEFDGNEFQLSQSLSTSGDSERLFEFVKALGWRAFSFEGNQDICDNLAVRGATSGIVPINRSTASAALITIADPSGVALLADLNPFDPLSKLSDSVSAYRARPQETNAARSVESASQINVSLANELASASDLLALDYPIFDMPVPAPKSRGRLAMEAAEQAAYVAEVERTRIELHNFLARRVGRKANIGSARIAEASGATTPTGGSVGWSPDSVRSTSMHFLDEMGAFNQYDTVTPKT